MLKQLFQHMSKKVRQIRQVHLSSTGKSGWVEDLRDNASICFVMQDDNTFAWDRTPTKALKACHKNSGLGALFPTNAISSNVVGLCDSIPPCKCFHATMLNGGITGFLRAFRTKNSNVSQQTLNNFVILFYNEFLDKPFKF